MSDQDPTQPIPPGHQPNWGSAYPQQPPPPPQYPPSGYQQPYYLPPKHPQATTAMVLGILGLALCGIIAPFAWSTGSKALKEIDANPASYSGRGEANAGKIMGIVGTCFLAFGVLALVGLFALGVAVDSSTS
jgi:hypothetical protein